MTKNTAISSARPLADITAEIRFYKAQTAQGFIEIGRRLIEAKEQLEHGQWLDWLRNDIGLSQPTANRLMRIARDFTETNHSALNDLSYTKLVALLAVPSDEREEFIENTHVVAGEEKSVADMTTRELEQVIRERDAALREQEKLKAQSEERMASALRAISDAEKSRGELDCALRERDDLRREVKALRDRPIDVAVRDPSEEELDAIRNQVRTELVASRPRRRAPVNEIDGQLTFTTIIDGGIASLDAAVADCDPDAGISMLNTAIQYLKGRIDELYRNIDMLQTMRRADNPDAYDVDF